jgi:hypothetical protein
MPRGWSWDRELKSALTGLAAPGSSYTTWAAVVEMDELTPMPLDRTISSNADLACIRLPTMPGCRTFETSCNPGSKGSNAAMPGR